MDSIIDTYFIFLFAEIKNARAARNVCALHYALWQVAAQRSFIKLRNGILNL